MRTKSMLEGVKEVVLDLVNLEANMQIEMSENTIIFQTSCILWVTAAHLCIDTEKTSPWIALFEA